ncbi:MAG: hypothetical protein R6X25_05935 [Candidatus Krumholzibacteriia bacterium]
MAATIYSVDYYTTTVEDRPGQGCRFLELLAAEDVNLLAFNAFPVGRDRTQLIIYPLNTTWLADVARRRRIRLVGPRHAFMVHGDDSLVALTGIHQKLWDAQINVAGSSGVANGRGGYRYIMHVAAEDFERACVILDVDRTVGPDLQLKIFRRFQAIG